MNPQGPPKYISPFPLLKFLNSNNLPYISSTDRLVALSIAIYRGSKSLKSNPSQSKLSKNLNLSKRTITNSINNLSNSGLLIKIRLNNTKSNHYFFTFDLVELYACLKTQKANYPELELAMKLYPISLKKSCRDTQPASPHDTQYTAPHDTQPTAPKQSYLKETRSDDLFGLPSTPLKH